MAFFSVLAAVILEHLRPLRRPLPHYRHYSRFTQWLERRFNAGEYSHGAIAWMLAVLPLLVAVWLIFIALDGISPFLGWVWNVAMLYFTLGFKYYSDDAEQIARLLRAGDIEGARARLDAWRGGDASHFSADEWPGSPSSRSRRRATARCSACYLVRAAGAAGPGRRGAVPCRLDSGAALDRDPGTLRRVRAAGLPCHQLAAARLTALTYAIAGNFEDATYCWRTQAATWPEPEEGVVLAAGAGAMGVRLGQSLSVGDDTVWRPELGTGQVPDADYIDSAVSMIWRGLVIWLAAGLLIVIAGWVA